MKLLLILIVLVVLTLALLVLLSALVGRKVRAMLPPQGEFMEVAGERIHYRTLGEGPPIVLVHGLGGQTRNFDYLPLQELAQRYRIVLLDRPGSGHSPRRGDDNAGITTQARIVAAFIGAMRFERKPLLVGHSLGGAIALAVALHHPDAVAGIGLIAPLTHFVRDVPGPFRALEIAQPGRRRLFSQLFALPSAILHSRAALAALFGPDQDPRDFPLRGGGLLGLRPEAFYAASTDMCAIEADLPAQQERYAQLRLPLFILYGEGDRILDWRAQGEALARKVPQAQLKVIPGGHMIPVTRPRETAQWLEDTAAAVLPPP